MSHHKVILIAAAVIAAFLGAVSAQTNVGDVANCGVSSKVSPKIVGGVAANSTSWPWVVALLRKVNSTSNYYYQFCGGSLITVRHVLTAAHCLPGVQASSLLVRLGEYDFRVNEPQTIDVTVSNIRSHESYNPTTQVNDIAILRMTSRVTYNTYIKPICLPVLLTQTYANYLGWIAGWGTTSSGGSQSPVLLEASIRIWPQSECNNRTLSDTGTLPNTTMCAGELAGGKDTCQGDSGGPLMVQRSSDRKWEIVGTTSWGRGCARPRSPGVYTRVTSYISWIAPKILDI